MNDYVAWPANTMTSVLTLFRFAAVLQSIHMHQAQKTKTRKFCHFYNQKPEEKKQKTHTRFFSLGVEKKKHQKHTLLHYFHEPTTDLKCEIHFVCKF